MEAATESIRVLYVDDEPSFAEMAATFLEREDDRFDVETVTSGAEGCERLADETYGCVISDYDMPGQNGIEFLETVREDHPDLPFILYTGKGSEEVAGDAISAGVTDYIQKKGNTDQYALLANRILNAVDAHRSQRVAQERTRRLETLISNLPGIVYRCRNDPEWPMETVRGDVEELTGYSADALENDDLLWGNEILHSADRKAMWETVQEELSADGTFEVTYRIVTEDGATKWMWERGRGVYDDDGRLDALEGFITDITGRKRRERELREEQAFIERSLDALEDIFYFVDTDGDFQRWNRKLPELTGYSDAEIGSMNALDFFEGEHREAIRRSIREILETGSHVMEADITTADGRAVPHEFRGVRMTNDDGEPTGVIGIARDVTERRERERRLERRTEELEQLATKYELQYRTLFEEAPVMTIFTRSEDGRPIIEDCNGQFVETVGCDEDAIVGSELAEFYTPESVEKLRSGGYDRSLDGRFAREKRDIVTSDGEIIETVLRAVPRRTADGDVIGTVAMYIDITERESVMRANERLEEFTNIVSHDLRNPLNVATGRLELAAEECDSDHLDRLRRALDRMETLIDDLLTLAREGEAVSDPQPVDLGAMIDGCWENVETNEAVLAADIDRTVRADRSRLKQLFENLFRNSIEHGGADVAVTVGELDDGFYVEDDGPGIPSGERDEAFKTGYTGRPGGTGFGLSIVEQVVTAHNWQIRITDGSDGGARFEITDVEFVSP